MTNTQILAYLTAASAMAHLKEDHEMEEAMTESALAIQRLIPEKPKRDSLGFYICPVCGLILLEEHHYCSICGQKIDREAMEKDQYGE